MATRIRIAIFATALLLLISCGYRFSGGGELPSAISSIAVDMYTNKTVETGIETFFTSDLIYELNRAAQVSVVPGSEADATLRGEIASLMVSTISRKDTTVAAERRVFITLNLKLVDRGGKVIWARKNLTDFEAYTVDGGNDLANETSKRNALKILSQRMAEYIYKDLTDEF